jgi:hypothetical protein
MLTRQMLAAGLLILGCSASVRAEGRSEVLSAEDGQPISITYYPASDKFYKDGSKENTPVVILLPGDDDQGRILWDKGTALPGMPDTAFPLALQERGYAVITVDLRKFGESKSAAGGKAIRPIDYEQMVLFDLPAVKQFLFDEHQKKNLNMNKTAIIGAGPTAPIAAAFAANDWQMPPFDDAPVLQNKTPRGQDIRALVLLSPDSGSGRLTMTKPIALLRQPALNVAMLVLVGSQDSHDKGQAEKAYDLMMQGQKGEDTRMYLITPMLKDRGVHLLGKQPEVVETAIMNFLDKHLMKLDSPWRDRRNKITG